MVVPANQNTQPMKPKPSRMTISSSRQPRADRQHRPSSRVPPSRKTAKIHPADDQQQRLGEDDDADDEQRHAEPHRRLAHLAADEGVAEFGRAGPLDVRLDGRRLGLCRPSISPSAGRSECRRGRCGAPRTSSAG
jgi:hypothetical protein